jgi:hypothetical protein
MHSEQVTPANDATKSIQTDLTITARENVQITKNNLLNSRPLSYSNKSLASSTTSIHKLKINPVENKTKPKVSIPAPAVKKGQREFPKKSQCLISFSSVFERKLSVPLTTVQSNSRRSSLAPPQKALSSSTKSVPSFGSQSSKISP